MIMEKTTRESAKRLVIWLKTVMSKRDLAEELEISQATVSTWMARGLPHMRLGKFVFFEESKVLDWLRQQEVTGRVAESE
jgi:hypothetical protein